LRSTTTAADNVALSVIITAWHLVNNASNYDLEAYWPGDGVIDILAFDAYNEWGSFKKGERITTWTSLEPYVSLVAPFAAEHDVAWAVAETGWTDEAARRDPRWFSRQVELVRSAGGIAVSYFDSSYESTADWTLNEPVKLADFAAAVDDSARICHRRTSPPKR
jgi:hypothetical protein